MRWAQTSVVIVHEMVCWCCLRCPSWHEESHWMQYDLGNWICHLCLKEAKVEHQELLWSWIGSSWWSCVPVDVDKIVPARARLQSHHCFCNKTTPVLLNWRGMERAALAKRPDIWTFGSSTLKISWMRRSLMWNIAQQRQCKLTFYQSLCRVSCLRNRWSG